MEFWENITNTLFINFAVKKNKPKETFAKSFP